MAHRNPTVKHLFEGDGVIGNASGVATEMPRPTPYGLTAGTDSGGWQRIAERVLHQASGELLWFPDTNVKINPGAQCFWDAAQFAYASTFRPQVVLTQPVLDELEEWLIDPRDRGELAREVQRCLSANVGFARAVNLSLIPRSLCFAFNSYLYMSTVRRYLALPCDDGTMLHGLDKHDRALTMSKIVDGFGHRARMLARAGLDDIDAHGVVNIADEAHVTLAFFYAVLTETPVCIVTTDKHLFEIFFKLQAVIDNHYRCFLAAEHVASGSYGQPELVTSERTGGFFTGPCQMYRKRTVHLDEVMRERRKYFAVELILVEHDGRLNYLRYTMEPEMKDMMAVRATTRGRSSALFGQRGIYVDMGPLGDDFLNCICVGEDVMMDSPVPGVRLSVMDAAYAVYSHEFYLAETTSVSLDELERLGHRGPWT